MNLYEVKSLLLEQKEKLENMIDILPKSKGVTKFLAFERLKKVKRQLMIINKKIEQYEKTSLYR